MTKLSDIPVVILAAGENSRFFPLNTDTHKGALKLVGAPLVIRTLNSLSQSGFKQAYIIVSEKDYGGRGLSQEILKHKLPIKFSFLCQSKALGMGEALLSVRDFIKNEYFAVVFPYSIEAGNVLLTMSGKIDDYLGVLSLTQTNTPWLYGIVEREGNRVVNLVEKPKRGFEPSNLKLQGAYILHSSFFSTLAKNRKTEYSFEEALRRFVALYPVSFIELQRPMYSLKYPWHLFDFRGGLSVGSSSYIGRNVILGKGSLVVNSIIEDDCVIGDQVTISNSIVFSGSKIFSDLRYSIVGSRAMIGHDIKIDYQNSSKSISCIVKGQKIDSGLKQFGCIIGNRTIIGNGVQIKPGILVAADTQVSSGKMIESNINHNSMKI